MQTAATAKPGKKRKNLPLHQIIKEENEPWGGDDDQRGCFTGVSRSFDQRRQVSSFCGLRGYKGSSSGSFPKDGSWAAGKYQPSLRKSSTIGFVGEQAAAGGKNLPSDRNQYAKEYDTTTCSGTRLVDVQGFSSRDPGTSRSFGQVNGSSSFVDDSLARDMRSIGVGSGGEEPQIVNTPEAPIELCETSTIAPPTEPKDPCQLASSLAQTAVGTQVCEMISKEDEEEEASIPPLSPTQLLSKLLSEIDPRDLEDSLAKIVEACPNLIMDGILLKGFLNLLESHLSGVTFRWDDIFKQPVWSKIFHDVIDVSHIPEDFYNITAKWIYKYVGDYQLRLFLDHVFNYIIESVWNQCCQKRNEKSPISFISSNVATLVAAAIVLRSQPSLLTVVTYELSKSQRWYEPKGALTAPLALWMTVQASQTDILEGLNSWGYILLPLAIRSNANDQTKGLILDFVENISKIPDLETKLSNTSMHFFPASSLEILLRLAFPATEEATTRRFAGIYPLFKYVTLANVPQLPRVNEEIFTFCFRFAKQGNTELAKEATEIATLCLTKHVHCWIHWEGLCKPENLETSVTLLKRLVEKWEDHSLQLSLLRSFEILDLNKRWRKKRNKLKKVSFTKQWRKRNKEKKEKYFKMHQEAIQEVKVEQEVKIQLEAMEQYVKKAMEQYVKMQQEAIQEVKVEQDVKVEQEAMEQELKLAMEMEQYVKKAMEQYVKMQQEAIQEAKIQQEAMEQDVKIQQAKIFTEKIFTFSLRLAGKGNPVLAKEATEIAIWSLTENFDWWKVWENHYKENLEASVVILKTLVEKWKDHSLKLSTWSLNHTKQVTQKIFTKKIFTFSLRLAERGNPNLAKEATEMAIWSLTENIDCWMCCDYLYKKNLEANVALLKKFVEKWKDRSLKLSSSSSSPSDTLKKIYTLSLRLAGEGNHVLAKEATEIAIWSLVEKDSLCPSRDKKNLKAVVALLEKPIDKWNHHSLKLLSSRSDTLTLRRTMMSFRLKNKSAITQGGTKIASLYKEADKSGKVIWGRLSRGSSSLKGTWIAALFLIIAVAARTVYMCERVFWFHK